jgi:hypothetical protein
METFRQAKQVDKIEANTTGRSETEAACKPKGQN